MNKVSIIFKDKPKRWGLRGDPYFWDYLENFFNNYELPFSYSELIRIIKEEHFKLTGEELTSNSMTSCAEFSHGGMSSGGISGRFWYENAFPLLEERLKEFRIKR